MRSLAGFYVVKTDAPSRHRKGITLFYKESRHFAMEEINMPGPNVISFQLEMGGHCWHVVGLYLALNDASTLECVMAAIGQSHRDMEILVAGEFNADMVSPYGKERNKTITAAMSIEGLEDTLEHFFPRHIHWKRYGRAWIMICCG